MSEFSVSNLERRIGWGLASAVSAMLLNLGLPFLLIAIGIDPKLPVNQGPYSGMGIGILIIVGFLFSGSAGFVAGLVRPGIHAVKITLICLLFADICLMGVSTRLYAFTAAIKGALLILLATSDSRSSESRP